MNKRVIAIAAAASVVLVAVWYFGFYTSQAHSLHKANVQTASAKAQAAQLRSQIATLQQEKTQLPSATTKLTTLTLALPDTPAEDKLIDDINAAAVSSDVDWQNITPSKPTTYAAGSVQATAAGFPGGGQAISVALQVNGTYKQVEQFITTLDGMSRLLDVESVNVTNVGGPGKSSAQITSQIFFVPPAAGSPVTTTTVAP